MGDVLEARYAGLQRYHVASVLAVHSTGSGDSDATYDLLYADGDEEFQVRTRCDEDVKIHDVIYWRLLCDLKSCAGAPLLVAPH